MKVHGESAILENEKADGKEQTLKKKCSKSQEEVFERKEGKGGLQEVGKSCQPEADGKIKFHKK